MMHKLKLAKYVASPRWFKVFLIASLISVLVYFLNVAIAEVSPGNIWGLCYGTAATVLMAGVALFGVRRRTMKFNVGRSRNWLQFHLYAGTLILLLTFMHTGFSLPKGPLNWWLWGLTIWVTLSGFLGVFLQKWIPRILASGLSTEVVYERVPELIAEIRQRAEDLVQSGQEQIKDFYGKNIAAALANAQPRLIYYFDITGGIQSQTKGFDYLRNFLNSEGQDSLDELESLYKTKLEIDAHFTLQKALRGWLYIHVPLSLVLLVLVCLHLYVVFYY